MLFNSWFFIACFLPVTWGLFYLLQRKVSASASIYGLVLASLFFYGWWNPVYIVLILLSITANYLIGTALSKNPNKGLLALGVMGNLSSIAYFKYAGFLVSSLNNFGGHFTVPEIVLPLAISFFTFQQIAFLVDAYRGEAKAYNFGHYCLFVTFFPQLIAGPIVHHKDMMPQFMKQHGRIPWNMVSVGLTVFLIGLFKKVVIADRLAEVATPVFDAASLGTALTFWESWVRAFAYTLQLYFDFSGYSDMAIGLAALFGIQLPLNFFSPYKSTSIIEFWRRWHMTLSKFLKDYLYIPLGGNRKGEWARQRNLMITMVLGGLWHGANWTFVIWGCLHGLYLVINHVFRYLGGKCPPFLGWLSTFLAVMVAWVFFRSDNLDTALHMLNCMIGVNGFEADFAGRLLRLNEKWYVLGIAFFVVILFPSTHVFVSKKLALDEPAVTRHNENPLRIEWSEKVRWAIIIGFLGATAMLFLTQVSEFIYFQF